MSASRRIQYVSDADGKPVGVLVPIAHMREIASERETAYLLKSEAMRERLSKAKDRTTGTSLADVKAKLGV